jgi:hypothetical protein
MNTNNFQFNLKHKYVVIGILVSLTLLIADIPEWAISGEHKKYSSAQYFLGVGSAPEREQAVERARANLIKQINVKIESEFTTEEREVLKNEEIESSSKTIARTKSIVDATVSGIEIAEVEQHKDNFYVLVILHKDNYFQTLKNEIDKIVMDSRQLIENARKNRSEGRIFNALDNYQKAQQLISDYIPKNNLLVSLSGRGYKQDQLMSETAIENEMSNIISNIDLKLLSGANQTAVSGQYLPRTINARVIYKLDTVVTGVDNYPVIVKYADGEIISEKRSNNEGIVNFRIKAISTGMTAHQGTVILMLDPQLLPAKMQDLLNRSKVEVNYKIETPDLEFALELENNPNYQHIWNKVENIITSSGYNINDKASLKIQIDHEVLDDRQVKSPFGTQHLVEIGVNFRMISENKNEKLGTYSIDGRGLSKNSKEDAIKVALQRIKIKKEDFISFLNLGAR